MTRVIVSDETYRTITVYDPDVNELSEGDAQRIAIDEAYEDRLQDWEFVDCERVNYNKVKVRFQQL